MKRFANCILILTVLLIFLFSNSVFAESADYAQITTKFNSDSISNALIVSDEEIYLCGLYPDGSWLKKTNVRNDALAEWSFRKTIGDQPVIQCLTVADNALLVGLVDSNTQKAAVAIIQGSNVTYVNLPEGRKVQLWGMTADYNGLSIISHSDTASERTIYYNHVSINGITDSYQVGQSKAKDIVIADSFSCMSANRIYVLRMTQIDGVVNNCNRELISYDLEGRQLWQIALPSDVVIRGMKLDTDSVFLYGMQRFEEYNCALIMRYSPDGTLEWMKSHDEIEQVLDLNIGQENIYFAGTITDSPEQFCIFGLTKHGTQTYSEKIILPEAYNTYLHYEDTHVSIIQNYDNIPCLWQISKKES